MNIVLINHYAGSPQHGMEFRPYYLAREWVRAGHRVTIVAATQSHVRSVQPARAGHECIDGIEYLWIATPRYSGNGLGRAWNVARFLLGVARSARHLAQTVRPDVVIASSTYPMDIWVARRIARRAAPSPARLVYEVHDLWPMSLIELAGMPPWHPFVWLCGRAERAAYRHADRVVSMLPKVHEHMRERGLNLARLAIVPNGVAAEDWTNSDVLRDDVAQVLAEMRAQNRLIVGYAGSMGLPNALDTLLDAACLLQATAICIVMVGDGHERERLARRVAQETITNVTLLPPIPKSHIPAFLGAIDIAYIGWRNQPMYRFGIAPNKLMDYMMAGCAVLHSVQAANDPVEESGCGLTVAPQSPTAVADGLRRLAALSPEERAIMGRRGREFVLMHFSYAVLARRFLEAMS